MSETPVAVENIPNLAKRIDTAEKAHATLDAALNYTGKVMELIQGAPLSMTFNGIKAELVSGAMVPLKEIARLRAELPKSGPLGSKQAVQVATVLTVAARTLDRTGKTTSDPKYQLWPAFKAALLEILKEVKDKALEVAKAIGWPLYATLGVGAALLVYKVAK